jgi:hypothetical protein
MDPITIGLIATGALGKLGGILGAKKRKQLDPNQLRQLFGAKAVTDEQMELFNRAMGSAQGQKLMTDAAEQGQQYQTDVARRAADAGLGPSGGASGGADIFAGAASDQAVGNLQRSTRASLMEAMLPIAQNLVQDRMQAWLSDRDKTLGQTSRFQDIMGAVGGLSSDLLASREASQAGGTGKDKAPAGLYDSMRGMIGGQDSAAPAPSSALQSGTAPPGVATTAAGQPQGTQAMAQPPSQLALANPMVQGGMPGSRERNMRMLLQGGGRFARAMASSNRFGAVQPAFGG